MKPPVQRIVVFRLTLGAHRETSHRGVWPVIRDVAHNRESGSAVGAVDEGIPVSPVASIEHFAEAIGTDRHVRRYQGLTRFPRLVATMRNS